MNAVQSCNNLKDCAENAYSVTHKRKISSLEMYSCVYHPSFPCCEQKTHRNV
ncbi:unnamed protein product [Brugia timori]|uniref:Uncharacterized protein n=1 Tax=Brugia timori TaxID=42155 RepID=A0A0R3QM31_9BILA|nr:unnamed protein product [Brugia timori]